MNECHVFTAVAHIALVQPERRKEVVEWFREVILFATEMLPKTQWFDCDLAGLMLHDLLDIQASELLPEIRKMFDTNLVDIGACGDYAAVLRLIKDPYQEGDPNDIITEVHKRFADMKLRWER